MENSLTTRNFSELNGQNISLSPSPEQITQKSSELNSTPKFFSINDLNNQLNINGNSSKNNNRRYKSEKIKKFLSNEESKPLGTIKEIVLDDQNENLVDNNPKKRFMIKEQKKKEVKEKKKLSFIEELRDFDRKQQISMEKYINSIKKKKFEYSYNKNLKNKYEKIYNDNINNLNNGLFNEGENPNSNEHVIDERIYNTPQEKDINNKNKEKDDSFEKIKKKYFSANLFSSRFPKSEYKVKYLNNYFNKDSLVKNLFTQYKETQNEKKDMNINTNINNINNEQNNNINTASPTNFCNINFNTSLNNSIAFKPSKKLDQNNRYSNLNEQSLNSINNNKYSMSSPKYKSPAKDEIENKYDKVLNSINEKLHKNKYKKKLSDIDNNNSFMRISSSDKIKSGFDKNKNIILDKNKSYNFFGASSNNIFNKYKLNSRIFFRNINFPKIGSDK